jgi:hypothetical protein
LRALLDELNWISDCAGREDLRMIFTRLLRISNHAHGK